MYFFFFVVAADDARQGRAGAAAPWEGAEGLEWEIPSPAPFHTFETPPKLNASATKIIG